MNVSERKSTASRLTRRLLVYRSCQKSELGNHLFVRLHIPTSAGMATSLLYRDRDSDSKRARNRDRQIGANPLKAVTSVSNGATNPLLPPGAYIHSSSFMATVPPHSFGIMSNCRWKRGMPFRRWKSRRNACRTLCCVPCTDKFSLKQVSWWLSLSAISGRELR